MPYIGKQLSNGNYLKLDDISSSFDGSTTTFSLTNGGSAYYPGSELSILVSVGGVIQEPESAYQINNDEITFANAPTAQDSFFCVVLGDAIGINVPGNNTVNGAQMAKPFNYDGGLLYLNDTDNRVGINSTSPSVALDVVGDLNVSGNLVTGIGGTLGGAFQGNIYASSGISTFNDVLVNGDLTVQGDTTTLNTTLRNVELLRVSAASTLPAGIITQTNSGDILSLRDSSTEVFKVADGGNVTSSGDIFINVRGQSFKTSDWNIANTTSGNALSISGGNSAAEKIRIKNDGSVGIGTDNPGVIESWTPQGTYIHVGGTTASGVMMKSNYPRLVWNEMDQGANSAIFQINMSGGDTQFQHLNDDGSIRAERVRITSAGQICINHPAAATRAINIKDPAQIYLESTSTGNWSGIQIKGSSGTNNYSAYFGLLDSNGNFFIDNASDGDDFVITQAGQVLIGGSSNSASSHADELQVINTSAEGGISIINGTSSMGHIYFGDTDAAAQGRIDYNHGGDYMRFYTANDERLRIYSGGQVSIRNTNATSFNGGGDDLVIGNATDGQDAGITLYSHSSDNGSIFFNDTADTGLTGLIQYRHGEDAMRFIVATQERVRITSAGFVQIGAAANAAEAPLHVTAENSQGINAIFGAKDFVVHNNYNYDDANIALQGRDAGDNDTGAGIQFTTRNTGNTNWLHGAFTQDTSGHFRFTTGGAGTTAGTTKVTITSGGNVGINEPNPTSTLVVRATTDDNPGITLYRNSGGGDVASLNWKSSSGTNAFIKWRGGSGNMGMHFYTSDNGNDGSTSEKIRIASTGQLLVHTGSNASGSIVMGGNYDGLGQTNSTAKLGTLMMPHYTNAEEPIQMIRGYSDSAKSQVAIGGGTNSANAATEIVLNTATSITGNGVARLTIDSNGKAVFSERTRTPQLGIGVEAQDHVHLHVQSADPRVLIKSTGTNASKIWFGDSGGTDRGIIEYQHTNDAMRFGTAGTEDRFVIKGDGKIAIGAPAFTADSALHIQTSGAYLTIEGTSASDNQGIRLNSTTTNSQIWKAGSSNTGYGGANSLNIYNDNNHPIAFYQSTNKRGELASTGNWILYSSLQMGSNNDGALMGKLGNKSFGSDIWGAGKGATSFIINGDSDKYYPVEIFPTVSAGNTRIQVYRGYSEQAPNDWYTSTHKGGLTFDFSVRFGSWGGYTTFGPTIYYFGESYATIVGGLAYISHSMRYCIWLRGGGTTGAKYYIDSPSGNLSFIVHDDTSNTGTGQGYYYSNAGTAGEQNNGNTERGWATYYHSTAGYRYYVDYIGNSTTLTNSRNNLKQYNLTGAHTTHGGGAHNP